MLLASVFLTISVRQCNLVFHFPSDLFFCFITRMRPILLMAGLPKQDWGRGENNLHPDRDVLKLTSLESFSLALGSPNL